MDVDLGTGHFELLANRNDLATDTSGDYAAHFELFFGHILPQYRDAFREHFSLEGLRAAFAAGVNDRNIHLEYQFAEEAGPRWRTRIAFAYTQDDGSCHVLQCIRDINEQKCAEFTHRRDEENLQVALQNSYAKIYRMNLAANQLTCLFCNTKLLAPIDVSGEFDKDIITVMKTRVHPRDRVVFRNFFTAETILRKLDAREELSVEYRKLGLDGTYHWMLALIVPLPTGNRGETVLLVRDVTEKKEEENNYLLALQNNYSGDLLPRRQEPHGHAAVLQQRAGAHRQGGSQFFRVRQAARRRPRGPRIPRKRARFLRAPPFRGTGTRRPPGM